jgi:1-deoxy-D-xylulose-5-phosphate synthase
MLIENFQKVKGMKEPVLFHVVTKKGKGYLPAENEPEIFHGIGPFAKKQPVNSYDQPSSTSEVFGQALVKIAQKDNRICAISAGMCLGTGLIEFKNRFPKRFFDVGICEQHAVTFAAGLALKGLRPVVAIYSTFLARAYDQIIQDVALQNLPVVFAVDRAGIVGEDGPTHHGNFDISYLRIIPNLTITAPKDSKELTKMLELALKYNGPFAIRYPRGSLNYNGWLNDSNQVEFSKAEIVYNSIIKKQKSKTIILAIGSMVMPSFQAVQMIKENGLRKAGSRIILVNARFVKPLDETLILELTKDDDIIITVEENILSGGFGSAVMEFLEKKNISFGKFVRIGLEDTFIEQGKREELLDRYGLSVLKLKDKFSKVLKDQKTAI